MILRLLFLSISILIYGLYNNASAQENHQMVRLVKLVIDPAQLESYQTALKEEIDSSMSNEPGVLTLYAMSEKENPTHINILEIYADEDAYHAHLQTPHYTKYKKGTMHMIKSLELVDVIPMVPGMKIK